MVESLIQELEPQNTPVGVVESDETIVKDLFEKGILCIHGDPSDKDTLDGANIRTANCLITNESDEMDANTILTAREMSDLRIIAILEDLSKRAYLEYAGASDVIAPKSILGSFIGRKAVDPTVSHLVGATEFLKDIEIIEFPIYPESELIGKSDVDLPWAKEAKGYMGDDHAVRKAAKEKISYEEEQTHEEGAKIWLRTEKTPQRTENKEEVGGRGS